MIEETGTARWRFFMTPADDDEDPHLWLLCGECNRSDGIAIETRRTFDLTTLETTVAAFKARHSMCAVVSLPGSGHIERGDLVVLDGHTGSVKSHEYTPRAGDGASFFGLDGKPIDPDAEFGPGSTIAGSLKAFAELDEIRDAGRITLVAREDPGGRTTLPRHGYAVMQTGLRINGRAPGYPPGTRVTIKSGDVLTIDRPPLRESCIEFDVLWDKDIPR